MIASGSDSGVTASTCLRPELGVMPLGDSDKVFQNAKACLKDPVELRLCCLLLPAD